MFFPFCPYLLSMVQKSQNNHLGCIKNPVFFGIFTISTGVFAGFHLPSTTYPYISTTQRLSKALPNILSDSGLSHQRQERSVDSSMCFHVAWLQIPGFKKWWFFKPWKIQTTKTHVMCCKQDIFIIICVYIYIYTFIYCIFDFLNMYENMSKSTQKNQDWWNWWIVQVTCWGEVKPRPKDAFFEIDMADTEEPKVEGVSWKDV